MDIVESNAQIEKLVLAELQQHFTSVWLRASFAIERRIKEVYIAAIKSQPEYDSLLRGRLRGEFGLTDVTGKLNEILDVWSKNIKMQYFKKTFKIQAIDADFGNVLGLAAASQATEKGKSLAWLEWLLLRGDEVIIREYTVAFNVHEDSNSRTGMATMTRSKSGKWSVPAQYSGTAQNNWITRAIDSIPEETIENLVFDEIEKLW